MDGRFSLQCQIQRMSVPIGPYKQGHKTTAPGSPQPRAASPACPKPLNPRAAAAMAPKHSAPPPPPVASSEETTSGSGSEEEEEDEEEIAHSPPPAAPKSIAPPRPKDQESEASDEDEDEDGEEEEEDEKANHVIPSSATKNPPPPPPTREEFETSDEEEEEEEADDEMPQTKPAPNQEMEAKGAKRPGAPFQRTWSTDDEFRILEALAAHRLEHGTLPQIDVLANALAGKLDNSGCSLSELKRKVKSLQSRNTKAVKKGALPSKDRDRRLFDLFKNVWPSVTKAATKAAANSGAGREPDEMCELYPYLAEEVKVLQKAHPGLFKREFAMIDDSKARALDEKIKRQRHAQMKLHLRRHDLTKVVTKTRG
ncbi:probable transcription factor At1g11510 [Miscanthus floridulus]|uniref:probable transcription factor At1g11510 n=1 Tax=Miscanthus floridulus TaxID=154761 RepID=UPI003459519C